MYPIVIPAFLITMALPALLRCIHAYNSCLQSFQNVSHILLISKLTAAAFKSVSACICILYYIATVPLVSLYPLCCQQKSCL
ncbi:hypothetical protein EV702DRAFT_1123013 [Suillus placidus]|uniref:Secreted protein n=1 Tax=Suillus placidus TaxID=48579 RepID=A0A9P6ZPV8_9AGAM|nr:hypothetical protein EV702DRAFT_1123013 [Suillus placidus]